MHCWLFQLLTFIKRQNRDEVFLKNGFATLSEQIIPIKFLLFNQCQALFAKFLILQPLTLNLPWKMTSCRKCGACCSSVGFGEWSRRTPVSSVIVQSEMAKKQLRLGALFATRTVLPLIPLSAVWLLFQCVSRVPLKALCTQFRFRRCAEWLKWALLLEKLFLGQDLNLDDKTLMKTRCPPLHSVYTSQ